MCSRVLYRGLDGLVLCGRSMDWMLSQHTNLWALPRGVERDGAARDRPLTWVSRYGSLVTTAYDGGTTDGINEAGLTANLLYLASATYPARRDGVPGLSLGGWAQFVLDQHATVSEVVDALESSPFDLVAPALPGGFAPALHLSIADASGDSAIFEYLDGRFVVHHGAEFTVMTNEPRYDQQLALATYWDTIGGGAMLPGTERPADRFVRASWYLGQAAPTADWRLATATVMSIVRNVSVPLAAATSQSPNVAPTLWRSVANLRDRVYFFEATNQPNVFWVELDELDLSPGTSVRRLVGEDGPTRSGEVSAEFEDAPPFSFLPEAA